jgi:hypothetical protein
VITHTLEASLTHGARECSYAPVDGYPFSGVIVIRMGKQDSRADMKEDVYGVEEATDGFTHTCFNEFGETREGCYYPPSCCAPQSFLLRRCGGDDEGLYLVTLSARPSCQCRGYNRWQDCKHLAAVKLLVRKNIL